VRRAARGKVEGKGGGLALALDPAAALPKKRSLTIAGHRTSITLEDAFWRELQAAAGEMAMTVAALVDGDRRGKGAGGVVGGDQGVFVDAAGWGGMR
jgi:hypothetical protein